MIRQTKRQKQIQCVYLSWSHNGTEISFKTTECSESANFIDGETPFYVNRNYGNGQIGEHFRDRDGDDDCNDGHLTDAVELRSLRKPQIVLAV